MSVDFNVLTPFTFQFACLDRTMARIGKSVFYILKFGFKNMLVFKTRFGVAKLHRVVLKLVTPTFCLAIQCLFLNFNYIIITQDISYHHKEPSQSMQCTEVQDFPLF